MPIYLKAELLWTDPFIDHFVDRSQDEIFVPQTGENIQAQIQLIKNCMSNI